MIISKIYVFKTVCKSLSVLVIKYDSDIYPILGGMFFNMLSEHACFRYVKNPCNGLFQLLVLCVLQIMLFVALFANSCLSLLNRISVEILLKMLFHLIIMQYICLCNSRSAKDKKLRLWKDFQSSTQLLDVKEKNFQAKVSFFKITI